MGPADSSTRRPCPTDRQLVLALQQLATAALNLPDPPTSADPPEELDEALALLCKLLTALVRCEDFWLYLWGESIEAALEIINLEELDKALSSNQALQLTNALTAMGMDIHLATTLVDHQVSALRSFNGQVAEQLRAKRPNAALLYSLQREAKEHTRKLRDQLCNPLDDRSRRRGAKRLSNRFMGRCLQLLFGFVTGAIASDTPPLETEIANDPAYLALRDDGDTRTALKALSLLAVLSLNTPGGPVAPVLEPTPTPV